MGGIGSDAAVEAADIVFMKDNPASLLDALKVAKETKKIVWQNIVLAWHKSSNNDLWYCRISRNVGGSFC